MTMFEEQKDKWDQCDVRNRVAGLLCKLPIPSNITKMVCFGLGNNIVSENVEETSQHPAALMIRDILECHTGNGIRLFAQDPAYSVDTKEILEQFGFNIVDGAGSKAFQEVDETTVVFCVNVGFRVKEILADLTRPAMIITQPFQSTDLDWDVRDTWVAEDGPARGVE
jgi:hypothetical protein